MKYKDFLDLWVENYVKPSCKVRTYDRYKQLIDLRISPDIGEIGKFIARNIANFYYRFIDG